MQEERKQPGEPPEVRDPATPPVRSRRDPRELPPQRNIVDAYTDAILTFAHYGQLHTRQGNYDSHMDNVREGEYEF